MVKRVTILFILMAAALAGSARAQGVFVKVFPDTSLSWPSGLNNTIACDPTGHVWLAPYGGNMDTLINGTDTSYAFHIMVYNPDGSVFAQYGPVVDFNGTPDTLFTAAAGYGACEEPDGNILLVKNSLTFRRFDYKTGKQLAKVENPMTGYASSLGSPMEDAAGEIFMVPVVPTYGVGPQVLANDFSAVTLSVDTSTYGNYARNVAVNASGNDVYAFHIGRGAFHYHSDNGTLGTYALVDTVFDSLVVESACWQPGTGWLWVSSGNVVSGMPGVPYSGYAWYGFDMTDPSHPVVKDSILWHGDLSTDPRPRGIAFSPTGDTAYVAAFNVSKSFCEQFKGLLITAVNEPTNKVPSSYQLSQNYPNPFNPTTNIDYVLKATGQVTLRVYDVLGRVVATLVNSVQTPGQHSVVFNASNLTSGVYFYSLTTADGFKVTKKMILMK